MSSGMVTCPVCGSDQVSTQRKSYTLAEPYAPIEVLSLPWNYCATCQSDGDFTGEAAAIIESHLEALRRESVKAIISDFNAQNISNASLERALELPQRTLSKWKSGKAEPTAAGIALLRIVRTYPWIVKVAEKGFEQGFTHRAHIGAAVETILTLNAQLDRGSRALGTSIAGSFVHLVVSVGQSNAGVPPARPQIRFMSDKPTLAFASTEGPR